MPETGDRKHMYLISEVRIIRKFLRDYQEWQEERRCDSATYASLQEFLRLRSLTPNEE